MRPNYHQLSSLPRRPCTVTLPPDRTSQALCIHRVSKGGWILQAALAMAVLVVLALAAAWAWVHQGLEVRGEAAEISVEPGTSPRQVAVLWSQSGVSVSPTWLYAWFRWSGQATKIRAGTYAVTTGVTPRELLDKMVQGDESLASLRIIEGWNWRQVRQALSQSPDLRHTLAGATDAEVARTLGLEAATPEGWLFPDTYRFSRGVSDLAVLHRAVHAMQGHLAQVWSQRAPGSPLKSPEQLLTLASIVEKETGLPTDRGLIAGVFHNRLKIGMALQTDPTVIYGLGEAFDGNLRRADLQRDTPYNTYTRSGLPPTPICMPGLAALKAAATPQPSNALYFVAKGDGSSAFSSTLDDHNRAVRRYQLGR